MRKQNHRFWLSASVAAALLLGLGTAEAADSITIASYGGQYTKSQLEAHYKPFSAKTGITVNSEDYNGGLAQLRSQVESGNVTWDVMDLEMQDAELACNEGLLETIDPSNIEAAPDGTAADQDFLPGTVNKCGIGNVIWSNVIAYDTTKFPDAKPTTVADFFDLQKFPGKRGMGKRPNANLEWALVADGVPLAQVYDVLSTPEGVDRAFAKLDTIKDSIVFWEAGAQAPQILADGEVTMTTAYSGRIQTAIDEEKKPFAIVWDAQLWNSDVYGVPKGAKNKDAAMAFVKFATSSPILADTTKYIAYGPVRKSSLATVDPKTLPSLPTATENMKNAAQFNYQWWTEHADEINERWAAWLAK